MAGPVELEVRRMGRRYSVLLRAVAAAGTGVLAVAAAPRDATGTTLAVVLAVNLWVFGRAVRPDRRWVPAVDVGVVVAVCLSQRWTLSPPELLPASANWVVALASITVAAYQWHTTPWRGAAVTGAVTAAHLAGAALAGTTEWLVPVLNACWLVVESVLSRGLLVLVLRGARAADRGAAASARLRREAAVAAARRADEREHLAALHDTAASTLLAIGLGVVDGREPWFARQVAEDLNAVRGTGLPPGEVDLAPLLADLASRAPVAVAVRVAQDVAVPAAVAGALCRAAREALANVARHAGAGRAELTLEAADRVVVTVADRGRGFDPAANHRHGRGIPLSIVDRMAAVGGLATVVSVPGAGTRVRLEWSGG